jgi:hypothetical protein
MIYKVKILQKRWNPQDGWSTLRDSVGSDIRRVQLVLIFGQSHIVKNKNIFKEIRDEYPSASLIGCATAGEILSDEIFDDSVVVTAVLFEYSYVRSTSVLLDKKLNYDLNSISLKLLSSIPYKDLVHIFVLADGILINGSDLVAGLKKSMPNGVSLSGGLSGDGYRFQEAPVIANDIASNNSITLVGLYGKRLKVKTSSRAGWQEYGLERYVTKAEGNVLYELDNESVLTLYEKYLGGSFLNVPASSIQYPISLKSDDEKNWMTRTIIGINKEEKSLTFAGDIPLGYKARLMRTNTDLLVESAAAAAVEIIKKRDAFYPDLAILVSCFGRRGVMVDDAYRELSAIKETFGDQCSLTGFYSYGEIGSFDGELESKLHNQTMTITAFTEE